MRGCLYSGVFSTPENGLLLPQDQSKLQHCVPS